MSVKLPLIIKREVKPDPVKENHKQQEPQEPFDELQHSQQNYEDDQFQEQPPQSPKKPLETIVVLRKEEENHQQKNSRMSKQNSQQIEKEEQAQNTSIQELRKILEEKIQITNKIKESITIHKKQIKQINDIIDKDLNKALTKTNKQNTVNIRQIFSAPPKSDNKKVNELNEDLKSVRITIKKIKAQIFKLSDAFTDPVVLMNQEKGNDFQTKLKEINQNIRTIEKEKQMISDQIQRGGKEFSEEEQKLRNDQFTKMNVSLNQLLNLQKDIKVQLYQTQKEDVLLMEKLKFFQEKTNSLSQPKKLKQTQKDKIKLDEQMKSLIIEINQILEQRNKVQVEKKVSIKSLMSQCSSLQKKNFDICNKMRDIDSFLLQYYDKKSKKKQIRNNSHKVDRGSEVIMQKSTSGKIQSSTIYLQTPKGSQYQNDKNKKPSVEGIIVQKRKNYEFSSSKQSIDNQFQFSDQFLAGKMNISRLIFHLGDDKILSMKAIYQFNKKQIEGFKFGSKNLPEGLKILQINFDRENDEIINFIHVGFNQSNLASYIHIVTTEGKEYKWGQTDKLSKSEQKHIKRYQSCFLKAKMVPIQSINQRDKLYCLSGITLSTVYIITK